LRLPVRHEFPTEWAKFKSVKIEDEAKVAALTLNLKPEHYPHWSQGRLEATKRVDFIAKTAANQVDIFDTVDESGQPDPTGKQDTLVKDPSLGDLRTGELKNIPLPSPTGDFVLYFGDNSMKDLWLAVTWGKAD
jgi:hypothetical protein